MRTQRLRTHLGKAIIGALAAALLIQTLGLVALADETAQATTLSDATPVAGLLPGSTAGSFAYFEVAYPGDGLELEVQVVFSEHDRTISPQLGLDLYGPNGYAAVGSEVDDGAYKAVSYAADDAATLVIQVYNYGDTTLSYTVAAVGLPEVVAEEAIAEVASEEATQENVDATEAAETTLATGVSGTLVGNAAGAFERYTLSYDGDESTVTVSLSLWPLDPSYANAIGFTVYSPDGTVVARGVNTETHGVLEADFASDVAGDYTIAIYNYAADIAVSYLLTAAA